jgi:hypothetical protein
LRNTIASMAKKYPLGCLCKPPSTLLRAGIVVT